MNWRRWQLWLLLGVMLGVLAACGRGDKPEPIPPTATPPVPTAPRPTALPSPTPTPPYLGLIRPEGAVPMGHLVFSTTDESQGDGHIELWTLAEGQEELKLVLADTLDPLWDCASGDVTLCVVGDRSGQVYTFVPPEALKPLLPAGEAIQRVFLSPTGGFAGMVSGGFMALLNLNDPADVVNVPDVPAISDVAWSVDGVRLAYVVLGEQQSLYVMRLGPDGSPPALVAQEAGVESPAWAGQERKLAFAVRGLETPIGGRPQRRDVFVADFETGEYINLTEMFGPAIGWEPARPFGGTGLRWGPDGETLDFVWVPPDEPADRGRLYRVVSDGDPELVMPVFWVEGQGWSGPVWSPDGQMEAAVAPIEARDGAGELWVSPAGEEAWEARSLSNQSVARFVWSPDGQYLAYEVPGDGIWIVPAAGGEPQRVVVVKKPYQVLRLRWLPG